MGFLRYLAVLMLVLSSAAATVLALPVPDLGPFDPIDSPYKPYNKTTYGSYVNNANQVVPFDVYYHMPANARGLVFFFHGTNGGANIVSRLEPTAILDELISRGFGFIATESERRPDNLQPGDLVRWSTNPSDPDPRVAAEKQRLVDLREFALNLSPTLDESSPVLMVGFSNGAGKAAVFGREMLNEGWNVPAIAAMSAGAPGAVAIPAFLQVLEHDQPPVGSEENIYPTMIEWHDNLLAAGIPTELHVGLEKVLVAKRFNRIPTVEQAGAAEDIFNLFVSGIPALNLDPLIDNTGHRADADLVASFGLLPNYDTPLTALLLSKGVSAGQVPFAVAEIQRQVEVVWAGHALSAEFVIPMADFLEAQIAVPEPSSALLFVLIGLAGLKRRRVA